MFLGFGAPATIVGLSLAKVSSSFLITDPGAAFFRATLLGLVVPATRKAGPLGLVFLPMPVDCETE